MSVEFIGRVARIVALLAQSTALAGGFTAGVPAHADDLSPASNQLLDLEEAMHLGLVRQPLLEAQAAAVSAARENALAAGQLPDPRLTLGLQDWPIEGPDRFSLHADNFTQLKVGVMQEFTRGEKRRLRGERSTRQAEMAEQELGALQLLIRRDVALAWLQVWRSERAAGLAKSAAHEADLQAQAADISYRAGRATQAEVLAARVALQLAQDAVADLEQQGAQARNALSRWIGADADRPVRDDLPVWGAPPDVDALLERLRNHPLLNSAAKQAEVAQANVQLARAAYRPDWSLELYYANRVDFADFVGVNFTVDLPIFTANRQGRGLATSLQEKRRADELHEDLWRQEAAEMRRSFGNWQRLRERLARYDQDLLPQSAARIEAARLAWQLGQGTLGAVLDARRVDLENRLKRLDLERDAAVNRVTLQYLAGDQP